MTYVALCMVVLVATGCSGGLSRQVRDDAVPVDGFEELRARPDRYRDETVILGGEIVETRNTQEGTTLLVLERALGLDRRPKGYAPSAGRFMVRFEAFLDPVQFAAGRQVTVAGRVSGTEEEPVAGAPYAYVLLQGREIHLWPLYEPHPYWYGPYPYPYPPPYRYGYYGHGPWWPW